MSFTLVAAFDENRLIGANNNLPWYLPADLKIFKQNTLNKPILMGRKTCESLKKPLPKRTNWVLTRQPDYHREGFRIIHDWRLLLGDKEVMVIGGAKIFELLLPQADKMIITHINATFSGDTYFPEIFWSEWQITNQEVYPISENNPHHAFSVVTYHRI
ncbi:MAG: dihydrofolate reductase [Proteobacteria bacterium]|nr:MAG: dihydrofolate reductase [Pseudomonadota bacterium]